MGLFGQSSEDRRVEYVCVCEPMLRKISGHQIEKGMNGSNLFFSPMHTKAWASVEAGVFYAVGSYCLDRFNRNPGPRLSTCQYMLQTGIGTSQIYGKTKNGSIYHI